jgi:hypothetical protein
VKPPHATISFPVGWSLGLPFYSYSHESTNLRNSRFICCAQGSKLLDVIMKYSVTQGKKYYQVS